MASRKSQKTPQIKDNSSRHVGAAHDQSILNSGLYVTATPIGNLRDITLRALDALGACDLILCEDTRVTRKLLDAYGIKKPLMAYHDHNAARIRPRVLARLEEGERICLVSDAGTPLIADPGYRLVAACASRGIAVMTLPGACAPIAALSVSGLPTDRFMFAGFLPAKAGARQRLLEDLAPITATLAFLESPRRLKTSLLVLAASLGPRAAVIAREITKKFEELRRGDLSELAAHFAEAPPPMGEVVILVGPPAQTDPTNDEIEDIVRRAAGPWADKPTKKAAAAIASEFKLPRRAVYTTLLALKKERGPRDAAGGPFAERDRKPSS
jgi:16S rRNA (cytidine1402-2'-O)-methyltransferase